MRRRLWVSILGYDPLYPSRNGIFFTAIDKPASALGTNLNRYLTDISNFNSPLLNLANIKHTITIKYDQNGYPNPDGKIIYNLDPQQHQEVFSSGPVTILENTKVLPASYLSFSPQYLPDPQETLLALSDPNTDYHPLVSTPLTQNYFPSTDITPLNSIIDSAGETSLDFTSDKPGLVTISTPNYPGWHAYLDGQLVPILTTNYLFMGIEAPAGTHHLTTKYEPLSFKLGLYLALLSSFLFIPLFISSKYLSKSPTLPPSPHSLPKK